MRKSIFSGLILSLAVAAAALAAKPAHHGGAGGAAPSTVLHISSHLAEPAHVTVDGKAITAPGYGSTTIALGAGHHVVKVAADSGVNYQEAFELKAGDLMTWRGKGYWCVNLLESSLEHYSKADCQEDVTDAG